jgi:hypothetical protein
LGGIEGKAGTKQLEAKVEKLEQMLGQKVVELDIAKFHLENPECWLPVSGRGFSR